MMGHEIAHALQEHARERIAKSQLTQLGASLLGELLGGGRYSDLFSVGGNLLTLRFSRDDESRPTSSAWSSPRERASIPVRAFRCGAR